MSTAIRRSLHSAIDEAEALCAMFPQHAYVKWEIAGSVRRRRDDVGDVEHVVIPAFGDAPTGGLFPERVNLFWYHLDAFLKQPDSPITKHIYSNGFKWGEKLRGIDFHGHLHELWCADNDNWGATLAIRTGPAEFSQKLVTGLLRNGRRNHEGYVWRCDRCECGGKDHLCHSCGGRGLKPVERLSAPDERQYFELCGVDWAKPEERR